MRIIDLIQDIQALYSKGAASDDTRLRRRVIYSKMLSIRNQLLSQKRNKKQTLTPYSFQQIEIEVEPHKLSVPFSYDCKPTLLRSKQTLPDILSDYNGLIIEYVGSEDGYTSYDKVTYTGSRYAKGSKYTSKANRYYIKDNYLYLMPYDMKKAVYVSAVLANPLDAYADHIITPAYERDFNIDDSLLNPLKEMVVSELLSKFGAIPEDKTNDGRDDREQK